MIRVDGLSFTYAGAQKPALRNLSFAIETGEVFGFLLWRTYTYSLSSVSSSRSSCAFCQVKSTGPS
jgi:hypothetical protein